MRDLQLCLLSSGGAELCDLEAPDDAEPVWASDSDEDFAEEFPEILDENDVEHLQDYLEEHEICTSRELEAMEIITDPLDGDDEEDDDEEDGAEWDEDDDVIDGEIIDHA
jgi:hypothetical protein